MRAFLFVFSKAICCCEADKNTIADESILAEYFKLYKIRMALDDHVYLAKLAEQAERYEGISAPRAIGAKS